MKDVFFLLPLNFGDQQAICEVVFPETTQLFGLLKITFIIRMRPKN